jgi:predicted acyl esterase
MPELGTVTVPQIAMVRVRDRTEIAVAIYSPQGRGPFPALFAPSPYRFDNNILPASPQFLWRETGPIDFYVEQGYAYVHMDVRGSGRSAGEYNFLGRLDQQDLYDVIEWIGQQPWSNGKVGGIGQSYYCMLQWFMGAMAPPALACLAAHDGMNDPYRASMYQGGIPGEFFYGYWWTQNRIINRWPANGAAPREQPEDLAMWVAAHPNYDEFWRERCAWEVLDRIKVPLYSSGVWAKMQLHTRGNIDGFRKARGPKKLRMSGAANAWAAAAEFASVEFHQRIMLPFYDHYLKGKATDYLSRPAVEYAVRGSQLVRNADTWPPPNVRYRTWYLGAGPTGSVTSFNDGALATSSPQGQGSTSYDYPNPGWVAGVVGFGPSGPAGGFDPVRRVLTFTTAPLQQELEICGPIKLVLHASSTCSDTDFIIKLSDQFRQSPEDRAKGLNPASELVTRGWLRASHRALDPEHSSEMEPYHTHAKPEAIVPGEVYRFDISLEPMAYLFRKDHRIRLEIANGDSPATEVLWTHYYRPDKIGRGTVHHDGRYPSALILPVTSG